MKYKIAYAKTASELEVEVNSLIDMGWQPIGGLATMSTPDEAVIGFAKYIVNTTEYLFQAMIYRPSPEPSGVN